MPTYRMGSNGFINDQISDAELPIIFKNLAALRRDSLVDFTVVMEGHVPVEIIRLVRILTGDSFSQWMRANADGPLGPLIRDLLNYTHGKVGHLTIQSSITMQEERLRSTSRFHDAIYVPSSREGSTLDVMIKNSPGLFDYDLFRLIGGIGFINVGRIFLLLGGDTYYAV